MIPIGGGGSKKRLLRPDFLILGLIAITSLLLVGGILPSNFQTSPSDNAEYIPNEIDPQGGDSSLQLKPITFKKCSSASAIDFLVDNSGSMNFGTKMPSLKKGLLSFTTQLADESIIGMQSFSASPVEIVPVSYYKDVSSKMTMAINSMTGLSATHTKDAFAFTQGKLNLAMQKYPDKQFVLIFISDGIPETGVSNSACNGGIGGPFCTGDPFQPGKCRCFAPEQDPTDIASQIKAKGVRIFTIAYVDTSDSHLNEKLQTLMRNAASSPNDYYMAPDDTKIGEILSQISVKICENVK